MSSPVDDSWSAAVSYSLRVLNASYNSDRQLQAAIDAAKIRLLLERFRLVLKRAESNVT